MKVRIRTTSGIGTAGAVAMIFVLAGCGGASAASYAITPAQALAAFNSYNHNNAKANETLNTSLQNQNETGTSAEIDDAYYQTYRDQGKTTEGKYSLLPKPYVIYPFNYAASPLKAGGTEYFVATTGKTSKPYSLILFSKTGVKGNWQVLYEPTMLAGQPPEFIANGGGYYDGGPLPKQLVASPVRALNDLVDYFNSYNTPSTPSLGPFAPGPTTTGFMTRYQNNVTSEKQHGVTVQFNFSQDSSPIVSLPVKGGTLVFGAYDLSEAFTWPANAYVVQNSARTNWPTLLAPGTYHTDVTLDGVVQVVMLVPSKGQIRVIGSYSGVVSLTGS